MKTVSRNVLYCIGDIHSMRRKISYFSAALILAAGLILTSFSAGVCTVSADNSGNNSNTGYTLTEAIPSGNEAVSGISDISGKSDASADNAGYTLKAVDTDESVPLSSGASVESKINPATFLIPVFTAAAAGLCIYFIVSRRRKKEIQDLCSEISYDEVEKLGGQIKKKDKS